MTCFTVLGGSGYIGRHLVAYLESLGHEVWVPQRDDDAIFSKSLGHVVYAIGLTANFRNRPFDTVEAHVCHLNRVLRNAQFDSLLYLSSTRVYGRSLNSDEDTVLQVAPSHPDDLYNLSKLTGEAVALNSGRRHVRVARVANIVGGKQTSDSFLASLIREAQSGQIFLRSALNSRKDYLHVDDCAAMLVLIATGGEQTIYNVASGSSIEHETWVNLLTQRFRCELKVAPGAPQICFPDISVRRFTEEFNYRPGPAIRAIEELTS